MPLRRQHCPGAAAAAPGLFRAYVRVLHAAAVAGCLGLAAASCSAAPAGRAPYYPVRHGEPLAARVDGEPIPLRFVEQDLRLQEDRSPQVRAMSPQAREGWRAHAKRALARRWADMYLVEREALRRGLQVTQQEVAEEMRRRAQALEDPERVQEMRQRYGVTLEDLRVRVRQRLLVRKFNRLLREDLQRRTTEEDLRRYYRDHLYLFRHPEQAYVRLLAVRDLARARRLERRAASGEDFAQLARRYSEHFTRDRGGEWGWVSRGSPEWEPVFLVRPGQVSAPFRYGGLWWVVKVEKVRGPGVQPYEEVRERVRELYLRERLQQEQVRITEELRRRARVEVLVP